MARLRVTGLVAASSNAMDCPRGAGAFLPTDVSRCWVGTCERNQMRGCAKCPRRTGMTQPGLGDTHSPQCHARSSCRVFVGIKVVSIISMELPIN